MQRVRATTLSSRTRRLWSALPRLILLGLMTQQLAACVQLTTKRPPPTAPIPDTYRVGAPDELFISVVPDPMLERAVVVRPDGMITFDLIGDVRASGRTTNQIAEEIERRIARYKRDARAMVMVTESLTAQVAIIGEVRNAWMSLSSETRVADAISAQGGTTLLAWNSRVRLIRTDGLTTKVHRINMTRIKRGDLTTNMLLMDGDMVVVPKTPLGTVGSWIQQITFPFTTLVGPALSAINLSRVF